MVTPNDDATDWEIDGAYGIGFYYIRCIADRYGHKKMLSFSEALLRDKKPAALAAVDTLGGSWPDISKRCLAYPEGGGRLGARQVDETDPGAVAAGAEAAGSTVAMEQAAVD